MFCFQYPVNVRSKGVSLGVIKDDVADLFSPVLLLFIETHLHFTQTGDYARA